MSDNSFRLIGRVGWLETKYTENGTCITTINLGVKKNKTDYENFFIKFLNSAESKVKIAEIIADKVRKGDYIRVTGSLSIDKFIPKNSTDGKEIEKLSLMSGYAACFHSSVDIAEASIRHFPSL